MTCAEPHCKARASVEVTTDGRARWVCFDHYDAALRSGRLQRARMR